MKSASLESFLLFFTFKSIVIMAYPTSHSEDFLEDNSIMQGTRTTVSDAAASVTSYTCVYIPPDLNLCDFITYNKKENFQNMQLSQKKKRKLLKRNDMYFTSRPSMRVPGMKKQRPVKTIIYKIERCVPPRLPFAYPWCTDEDLSDKKSEIRLLYPFAPDKYTSNITYEFPAYNFSKQILKPI